MYKITRYELLKDRPKWIYRLRLDIKPVFYHRGTLAQVREKLHAMAVAIEKRNLLKSHSRLVFEQSDDRVAFVNRQGRCYLSFDIREII